jgi:hypothetical protein
VGDVVLLRDDNRDGRAEPPVVVARRPQMHGIVLKDDTVFLVTVKAVFTASRQAMADSARRPAPCGAWTTASTGSAMTISRKS